MISRFMKSFRIVKLSKISCKIWTWNSDNLIFLSDNFQSNNSKSNFRFRKIQIWTLMILQNPTCHLSIIKPLNYFVNFFFFLNKYLKLEILVLRKKFEFLSKIKTLLAGLLILTFRSIWSVVHPVGAIARSVAFGYGSLGAWCSREDLCLMHHLMLD